jgi:arylsulfatase A-like enzyme
VAADWIRAYDDPRPFYLQVNFPGPHDPFDSITSYRKNYDPSDPRWPEGILEAPLPPFSVPIRISRDFQDISGITREQMVRLQLAYFAKVSMIDASVGEVLRALDERDRDRDTWIIYGSDHGEMLGDHQLVQKTVFYEQAVRVPLIVRPPGGVKGWRADGLTDTLDVSASILDIAGLAPRKVRGRSLVQRIRGGPAASGAQQGKEWVLSENYRHGMVRTNRFKMVANYRTVLPVELYDLEADPDELTNRVADPGYRPVIGQLAEKLRERVPARVWRNKRSGRVSRGAEAG